MQKYSKEFLFKDLLASVVVFLVALPLCMGIAIASGVPPILGLISGVIGGIIVGAFSGCPLQVSGPAAGLAVMVYNFIEQYGLPSLAPLGIIVGVVQLIVYKYKLAPYFKAISPALIRGLLGGIGLLILASQVHVAFDASPVGGGLTNLIHIPKSFNDFVIMEGGGRSAFFIAVITLVSILLWQNFAGKFNNVFPAPLFAIIVVVAGTFFFDTNVKFINISPDFISEIAFISPQSFEMVDLGFLIKAFAIAFVASAETLLSVNAVDKLSKREPSNYNKEIMAQGLGNLLAGVFGALPLTGVIVRSSANIESGAETRGSAIFHGLWLLILTCFFTNILSLVPISALAGILIFTGWKLLGVRAIPGLIKKSKSEATIYFVTLTLIVCVDLLTGVVVGFLTSVCILLFKLQSLDIDHKESDGKIQIVFKGKASFLQVPKISSALPAQIGNKKVTVDLSSLDYMDWAVEEQFESWQEIYRQQGGDSEIIGQK